MRVEIPFVLQDDQGNALDGTARVYLRDTTTNADVFAAATGGTPLTQPLTVSQGKIQGWVEPGSYDVVGISGALSFSQSWDAVPYSTGAAPTGAAGGDLTGTYPNPGVNAQRIQDVIAALDSGDKISWEYPTGTDVVELYGLRTAAGFAIAQQDTLNTDTTAQWTPRTGDGTQQINWSGTTWTLPGTGSYGRVEAQRPGWGLQDDQARMKVKGRVTANFGTSGQFGCGFANSAMTNQLIAILYANGTLQVTTEGLGSNLNHEDFTTGLTLTANTYYWVELTRSSNNRTVTIYAADGTTVLWTHTGAILAGKQSVVGAGISLYPVVHMGRATTGGQDAELDQIELYTQQPEARDLMVAVTPVSGGTRTVKRVFGSSGSATFRSDFLQSADLSAYAPLASPALTGNPTAPTQTANDNSTKLATTAYADRIGQQTGGEGINTQTGTTYTTVLGDAGKTVEMNNAAAMTITIPPNSSVAYPVGTLLRIVRIGAGTLTIVQGAGVVLRNKIEAAGTTNRTVNAQYGIAELYKRATDEWVLVGDIA